METFVETTGFKELDDALSYLKDKSRIRLGKAALKRMATVTAQSIRKFVPKNLQPKQLGVVQKGIGSRLVKGQMLAKAGIAVGKAGREAFSVVNTSNVTTMAYTPNKKLHKSLRVGRKGVGISARNLHWFALGTKDRYVGLKGLRRRVKGKDITYGQKRTGSPIKFVGRIDKNKFGGFVQAGARASAATALAEAAKTVNRMLDAEVKAARSGGGAPVYVELDIDS